MTSAVLSCALVALAIVHVSAFPVPVEVLDAVPARMPSVEDSDPVAKPESPGPKCCKRGAPCWPTAAETKALSDALDPQAKRNLHWDGGANPIPAPFSSPMHQPLRGMNKDLKPLYERSFFTNLTSPSLTSCGDFCKAATRNVPAENWDPAFVVFPLTAAHAQTAVKFARKHQLCVSVVGTGHDFLNRHSCNDGLMIRTILMKDMQWNFDGVVKLGAGLTFSEVTKAGAEQHPSVFIATGWSSSVGIAGWHLGGGHGPNDPATGLGVDNLVEIEVVTADGNIVTANAKNNSDLFWAMKGGGGSAWGVMTSLTVRKHRTPAGGFSRLIALFTGDLCIRKEGEAHINAMVDHWMDWALGLDERWGGIQFMVSVPLPGCESAWTVAFIYWFAGPMSDPAYHEQTSKLLRGGPVKSHAHFTQPAPDWWLGNLPALEKFDPIESWIVPFKVPKIARDFIPSALLSRDDIAGATFRNNLKAWLEHGGAGAIEFYQDLPHPNISKHFPTNATSISAGFRNGMVHLISPVDTRSRKMFVDPYENAYFSESNYNHPQDSWKQRYWGSNYDALVAVKKKYDSDNLFWCHNCVGSDLPRIITNADGENPDAALLV